MKHKKHITGGWDHVAIGLDQDCNSRGQRMEIEWVAYEAHEVFDYFVSGFIPPDGKTIPSYNRYYDPVNGRVIFRLRLDSIETPK